MKAFFVTLCTVVAVVYGHAAPQLSNVRKSVAPEVDVNPVGTRYCATLPVKNKTLPHGLICGVSTTGYGVQVSLNFYNFPKTGGPFLYTVHDEQAVADGNCASAGPRLDPYNVGSKVECDPTKQAYCQVGDLSGKHGTIDDDPYIFAYNDLYLSTSPQNKAFFGNRSIVIEDMHGSLITCGNFGLIDRNITAELTSRHHVSSTSLPKTTRAIKTTARTTTTSTTTTRTSRSAAKQTTPASTSATATSAVTPSSLSGASRVSSSTKFGFFVFVLMALVG